MTNRLPQTTALLLALLAATAWAGWLGWDQQRDVHPDGSVSGPYEAWQVIGLALTLLPAVVWAAARRHGAAAALGTSAGLTLAVALDWSDDGSGLFLVGAAMVAVGSLAATGVVAGLTTAAARAVRP
ncbi:hypothetical protein ACIRBX_34130 [Kitasatospora sp. NPDC096147]|uniref:hypothetical protein n=1 Tax=Kitasatospora sp. NPDC096147 TaxID=3364093 RepID=UPI0038279AE0